MTNDSYIAAGRSAEDGGAEGVYRGLGWQVVKNGDSFYLQHSGGGPGFAAAMRLYPDRDLGMVIMANGTYLDSGGIFDLVASLDW
jgi:CubicO group peptidase (beta-lactamase class C family)